nr:recombinase zinc beta ribbon domain-containing protein [uncultured Peptostreptococcus sp.]
MHLSLISILFSQPYPTDSFLQTYFFPKKTRLIPSYLYLLTIAMKQALYFNTSNHSWGATFDINTTLSTCHEPLGLISARTATLQWQKALFYSSHVLAQKAHCAECGDLYRRIHWYTRGKKSIVWRCISRLENAGVVCHNHTIYEEDLKQACVDAINQLVENKQGVLHQLSENLTKAITLTDALSPDAIQMRLDELQQRLIQSAQNKENYDALADEIYRLKEQKQAAQTSLAKQKQAKKKIQTAIRFLQK